MASIEEKIAAVWAKYNEDKGALFARYNAEKAVLLIKARQDVQSLHAEARTARRPKLAKSAQATPTPNQYWSHLHSKGMLVADFTAPLPDDWEEHYG